MSNFRSLLFTAALFLGSRILAQNSVSQFDADSQTLHFQIGQAQVALSAAKQAIFRMNICYDGGYKAWHTVFLDPSLGHVNCRQVAQGSLVGIATDHGRLMVDSTTGKWSFEKLLPETGLDIIATGQITTTKTYEPKTKALICPIAIDSTPQESFYGSGNVSDDLLQTHGIAAVGNGHAVIPYYWSKKGYGAFACGFDDDDPAQWALNPAKTGVTWTIPGKMAELYLMVAPTLRDASRSYAELSGPPLVPPEWVFGYLQSRWGWKNKAYIDQTLQRFESDRLPVDAFIFDFECYTSTPDYSLKKAGIPDFHDFGWNPALFSHPAEQIAEMLRKGVHTVPIRKPRLGDSANLAFMRAQGWGLAQDPHGWAPELRGFDFRIPAARAWYSSHLKTMLDAGVAGWWDDEGESFYTKYYYWNLAQSDARVTFKPGTRHWSLNRAFEPGLQRLGGTVWSGDIHSNWETLAATPATLLNWSLAGMPFTTCDIGGFADNPTPELLTRWMEAGVFFPMMRAHSILSEKPHFPWLFGPAAEAAIRKALDLRYQLIPYYYSLAHIAHETGLPPMRPLAMVFPDDPACADLTSQWMMGDSLMAAPILTPGSTRSVHLPPGNWYSLDGRSFWKGGRDIKVNASFDEIPVYVRAGSILPLGPVLQHTSQLPDGPLEIRIYPGADASFTLIEDEGNSTGYLQDQVRRTHFQWKNSSRVLSWTQEGTYSGPNIFTKVRGVEAGDPESAGPAVDLTPQGHIALRAGG
jgi:alpha-glucosidase